MILGEKNIHPVSLNRIKMKIGVWLSDCYQATMGGGFSYTERLISELSEFDYADGDVEIVFVSPLQQPSLLKNVICISQIPSVIYGIFKKSTFITDILRKIDSRILISRGLSRILKDTGIRIMLYPQQMACIDPDFPFISMNWDIGHRSTYSFPEVISLKQFKYRENFYNNVLPRALFVVVESLSGKEEIIKYTNIGEHKIRIVPLFAGAVANMVIDDQSGERILNELGLGKQSYFYYPAQFWAHKNHYNLIKAFARYCRATDNNDILVLSGSDKGNKSYILNLIETEGLHDRVKVLGFVENEAVHVLYKHAIALVMATHFGPTNMPPIEAMECDCPVVCSDLNGHKEILEDSAVYFNSFDIESISNALTNIRVNNDEYRKRIKERKLVTPFNIKDAVENLKNVLAEAVQIRCNWE